MEVLSPSTSFTVSSPRRTLSLLKRERRASSATPVPDRDRRASGEHGPKPSEVYGFVGAISTVISTVVILVWAYIPEPWLRDLGITYYPSKFISMGLARVANPRTIPAGLPGLSFARSPAAKAPSLSPCCRHRLPIAFSPLPPASASALLTPAALRLPFPRPASFFRDPLPRR
ncbi:hypothetical protein Taro_043775 [Colocasia esculenta]|uniref:PIG-P domain-containing protein n=1 Tax=Colocasia esculenta TaxID=4460 RepID=A0A843X1C2_COLES|nr:hypothetical protein [Colocasia esculenta]